MNLSQLEADALIEVEKHRASETVYDLPCRDNSSQIPLISFDKTENFVLDLSFGGICLNRIKYQNRTRQIIILVRFSNVRLGFCM